MVEVVAWRTLGLDLTKCQTNGCEVGSSRSNQLALQEKSELETEIRDGHLSVSK